MLMFSSHFKEQCFKRVLHSLLVEDKPSLSRIRKVSNCEYTICVSTPITSEISKSVSLSILFVVTRCDIPDTSGDNVFSKLCILSGINFKQMLILPPHVLPTKHAPLGHTEENC